MTPLRQRMADAMLQRGFAASRASRPPRSAGAESRKFIGSLFLQGGRGHRSFFGGTIGTSACSSSRGCDQTGLVVLVDERSRIRPDQPKLVGVLPDAGYLGVVGQSQPPGIGGRAWSWPPTI